MTPRKTNRNSVKITRALPQGATYAGRIIRAAKKTASAVERPLELTASFTIAAAEEPAAGKKAKPRAFEMNAYNGGAMDLNGWAYPVVVDLSGMTGLGKTRPILKNHDSEQIVGHANKVAVEDGQSLHVSGSISGAGAAAKEVVDAHDNEFPWQASIGARVLNYELVKEGSTAMANGRQFKGPVYIARKSVLGEVSFVPLGADDTTSARIAAGKAAKGSPMNFEQWLEAKGFALADLSAAQKASLQVAYELENKEPEKSGDNAGGKGGKGKKTKVKAAAADEDDEDDQDDDDADPVKMMRAAAAAESKRVAAIRKTCADKHPDIEAKAIEEGWDATKTELEVLRAERPVKAGGANINTGAGGVALNNSVLEAAVCLAGGIENVEKRFDVKVLEAAQKRYRRGIGLQELLLEAAHANGYNGHTVKGDIEGVLRAAFIKASGFSTLSLPGIFSNTANKFLLQGFSYVEDTWRQISAIRPASDFKTMTSYRLNGGFTYDKVGPDGELKHAVPGEESYNNKVDTYGKICAITRQDIINDDLGALTTIPQRIGRGAALKLNLVFWAVFITDTNFFKTGNKNYVTGAATNLQASSMTTATTQFMRQTDADGNPVASAPKILLVPAELVDTADALYKSPILTLGGGSALSGVPVTNVYAGRYKVVSSVYLTNVLAWYLLADPRDIAAMEVAFLNGQEQPTVETAEADFDTLGVQMRGYFDFGVAFQDPRAAVKVKGAA